MRLTPEDIEHIRDTLRVIVTSYDDDYRSKVIMLSIGYAEVWYDGDVIYGGEVIHNEDPDDL